MTGKRNLSVILVCAYDIGKYNFSCPISYIAHFTYQHYWIDGFQLFSNTFRFCHLLYQPRKHLLCSSVNIHKIAVQLATCQSINIEHLSVVFQIPTMVLFPHTNIYLFFSLAISIREDNSIPVAHTKICSSHCISFSK